ncbi:MAG: CcmD family protein [Bacteroidota bacterium]
MNAFINKSLTIIFFLVPALLHAQEPEMADGLRAEGKIYVLVAIILVILAGLIYFVLRLDNKLSRLERDVQKKD